MSKSIVRHIVSRSMTKWSNLSRSPNFFPPISSLSSLSLTLSPSFNPLTQTQIRSYAKKAKKFKQSTKEEKVDDFEEYDDFSFEKGKGKGKNKDVGAVEKEVPVIFDPAVSNAKMDELVDKLSISLKSVVRRVEKVSAELLDGLRVVGEDGSRSPIQEFATSSSKDGKDLIVTVYDPSFLKPVQAAIYESPFKLTPQPISSTTLKVPVPRPDWNTRKALVTQASTAAENAKSGIRAVRASSLKDLKDGATKDEIRIESKKVEADVKARIYQIDTLLNKAKKLLMDE